MNSRPAVSVILLGIAVSSAGCESSSDGYVEFDNTAPSAGDLKQVSQELPYKEDSPVSATTPVKTADGVDLSQTQRTEHAVSKTDIGASPDVPPAVGQTNVQSSELPTSVAAPSSSVVSAQSGLSGPADVPVIENTASSEPRKIELLVPEKRFRKERGTSAVRVNFDDIDLLKVLNMEPVPLDAANHFPDWLKAINGKPVRIRGFMYPTYEPDGLTGFTLARDNGICCFVRKPKIYDIIVVSLASGVTTNYIEGRPFDVEGIFRVDPKADGTDLASLYRIENATVID